MVKKVGKYMNEKKRILFVISGIAYSGAEIVLDTFIKANNQIIPFFYIILNNSQVEKTYLNNYEKKNVFFGHFINQRILNWFAPMILKNKIENDISKITDDNFIDYVYINNTFEGFLCANVHFNRKVFWHIHDMKDSFKNPYWLALSKKNFNRFDKILCVSYACKRSWGYKNINVVYNGLEFDWFTTVQKKYSGINKVGIVGRLSHNKGTDIVFDCLDDLVKKLNLKIYFVWNSSDSGYSDILHEFIQKYPNNIFEYKSLNKTQMMDFYDNIDLLLVPSRRDSLPNVILEASSRKCVIVGNEVAGIPELICDSQYCLDLSDSIKLFNHIEKIINFDDTVLEKNTVNQYDYVKNKFLLEKKVEEINEMFNIL